MSNFQGSIILIERGMVVEAQPHSKLLREGFWIGAFFTDPKAALMLSSWTRQKVKILGRGYPAHRGAARRSACCKQRCGNSFANRRAKSKENALGLEELAKLARLLPNYAF